jgi:predicted Zn-dependent protease with MMP-like domain
MRRPETFFQQEVSKALAALPAEFQPYLANLVVQVEDWPRPEHFDDPEEAQDEGLYGLYLGTPLTERGSESGQLPDRILIFRGPLEEDFPDEADLKDEIAITVIHEVAHHFGIDEARLEALGLD